MFTGESPINHAWLGFDRFIPALGKRDEEKHETSPV